MQDGLPIPILEDHPQWVELYIRAWDLAKQHIRSGTPQYGFVPRYMDEAFSEHLFQWDTCFMVMFARYAPHLFPGVQSLDNFYNRQHGDGFICRELREDGRDFFPPSSEQAINPPLFAWAEWGHYLVTGDSSRFSRVLPGLVAYFDWIKAHRRRPNGMYWTSNLGSGMDNSPRGETAYSWIDLTAQQALAAECIVKIADRLGEEKLVEKYHREYEELVLLVNELMWDEEEGIYYDLDRKGNKVRVKTVASFWPLLARLATPEQAARLVEHLTRPQEFWRLHLMPTLSADHPRYHPLGNYWQGGVWAPTNYMVIKGLENYGYEDLAQKVAKNHVSNMAAVYAETGTIWENYSPERPKPGNIAKPDFVGWSGLGPIALLIENVLGLRLDAPQNILRWRISRLGEHGIQNLRFGDREVSLLAHRRQNSQEPVEIEVDTSKGFYLDVEAGERKNRIAVTTGRHTYRLGW